MLDERDRLHKYPCGARRHLDDSEPPLPLQHRAGALAEVEGAGRAPGFRPLEKHFTSF